MRDLSRKCGKHVTKTQNGGYVLVLMVEQPLLWEGSVQRRSTPMKKLHRVSHPSPQEFIGLDPRGQTSTPETSFQNVRTNWKT